MAHPRDKRHLAPVCSRLHTLQVASSGERLPDETAPLKVDCSLIVRLSGKIIWISVWPIEAAHSAPIAVRYPPLRHLPQTIVTLMGRVFSSSASNITFRLAANVLHTSRFIYLLVIMVTKSMLTIFPESSHFCAFSSRSLQRTFFAASHSQRFELAASPQGISLILSCLTI